MPVRPRECELVAAEAAVAAGRAVRARLGRPGQVSAKAAAGDLVTDCDREAEALIRSFLCERFPQHAIFGEEAGGREDAEHVWYVDPIDGTTNFVHGLPGFCVSVGLCRAGRPLAGAVYDPVAEVLYSASEGGGATANGLPLCVSAESRLDEALLATGVPPVEPARAWALASGRAVAERVRNVRNLGSAALHLCHVAAGHLGGFWEPALRAWDLAAAVIILREAGGRCTSLLGHEWQAGLRGCAATNGLLHDELLSVLRGVPGAEER